jgi:tRNA pseudouridine55 synthase
VCLGTETDTLDPEGTVIRNAGIPSLTDIRSVLPGFIGAVRQIPPLYSALHYQGERAHRLARRGENIELPERTIRIDNITIVDFDPPFLTIDVRCSGGTYIRSLARDIGKAAGSCGYLVELLRTKIGRFSLEQSVFAEDVESDRDLVQPYDFFENLDEVEKRTVKNDYIKLLSHGAIVRDEYFVEKNESGFLYALFDEKKDLLAIVQKHELGYKYISVFQRGEP